MNKHECLNCFFRNKGEVWKTTFRCVLKIGEMKLKIENEELKRKGKLIRLKQLSFQPS